MATEAVTAFVALTLSAVLAGDGFSASLLESFGRSRDDVFVERVVLLEGRLADYSAQALNDLIVDEIDELLGEDHGLTIKFLPSERFSVASIAGFTATTPIYQLDSANPALVVIAVSLVPAGDPDVLAHESGHRAHDRRLLEDLPRQNAAGRALTGAQRMACFMARSALATQEFHRRVGRNAMEALEREDEMPGLNLDNEWLVRTIASRVAVKVQSEACDTPLEE